MAKKNEIQKVTPSFDITTRPDYLGTDIVGVDSMKSLQVFPRFKIVQKQADAEILKQYGSGDVIIVPEMKQVTSMPRLKNGQPDLENSPHFKLVPLFFYFEWLTINPIEMKGVMPTIAGRTLNPNDPLVAKSKNQKLRQEPLLDDNGKQIMKDGKPLFIRHIENICFICTLFDHPLAGDLTDYTTLSFAKGEWFAGSRWANLIRQRKASIYANIFEAQVVFRDNKRGQDWLGVDVNNPTEGSPWVSDEQYKLFGKVHDELEALFKERRIGSSFEEEPMGAGIDPNEKQEF